jgi:hypothetical protein
LCYAKHFVGVQLSRLTAATWLDVRLDGHYERDVGDEQLRQMEKQVGFW